ncbi:MAG: [FeFe] hydrogenase H-cluster maturation GTPase HydF, partial [Thermoplasmata archaeon HGW-Thermoplasmata-1]
MGGAPRSQRLHIAIFGRRNVGKSSLINAITNQQIALVSPYAGTTTDPVKKAMEILPIGPVLLIDTAGIDDVGELGELRVARTYKVLDQTDLAIVVVEAGAGLLEYERKMMAIVRERKIPFILAVNKSDLGVRAGLELELKSSGAPYVMVSASTRSGMEELKQAIIAGRPHEYVKPTIMGDLISPGDFVVLNCPIDASAPKGRLILPQVNIIRDILDNRAQAVVVQTEEIPEALNGLSKKPTLVVTDSQAFAEAGKLVPDDIPFTSFSILFARYLGDLEPLLEGVRAVKNLKEDECILIAEACTHHRSCVDIGAAQIPKMLEEILGFAPKIELTSGHVFP